MPKRRKKQQPEVQPDAPVEQLPEAPGAVASESPEYVEPFIHTRPALPVQMGLDRPPPSEPKPLAERIAEATTLAAGAAMGGSIFNAIRRSLAFGHLDFLDRVIRGEENDVYQSMGGPMWGPPSLKTRILAYNALTKGLEAAGAEAPDRGRRGIIMYPAKEAAPELEASVVEEPTVNGKNGKH